MGEVYGYWETLENLPMFMANVEEARPLGEGRTHWKIRGPFRTGVEFDAETTRNEPNEAIAWNSIGGDVETPGQVLLRELGSDRTRVEVTMNYADPPGDKLGGAASKIVANPKLQIKQDLENFKDVMEGTATPEEVQQRPSASTVQSSAVVFLTSGAGLLVLGGGLLLLLLRHRRNGGPGARTESSASSSSTAVARTRAAARARGACGAKDPLRSGGPTTRARARRRITDRHEQEPLEAYPGGRRQPVRPVSLDSPLRVAGVRSEE